MIQILLQRAWDWPSPHEIQGRARVKKEQIIRGNCEPTKFSELGTDTLWTAIPVSPASLFLLIGEGTYLILRDTSISC